MENNLIEIGKRYYELGSEFAHSGYTGELLDNHIIDVLSDEILCELGEIEKYDDIKKALINIFFLGQITK